MIFSNREKALANANRLRKLHDEMGMVKAAQMNPCTTIDILVEELISILK